MPAKNAIKTYVENGYYHIYNRGVEKRIIFIDDYDYAYFLYLLKQYLSVNLKILNSRLNKYEVIKNNKCISDKITLLCFCLMPNHFHLIVKQLNKKSLQEFMKKLCTSYSIYFNKKYNRQGTLFQGRYKAVLIETDAQLMHVSRYLHINPLELMQNNIDKLVIYKWFSYANYIGLKKSEWLNTTIILNLFSKNSPYSAYKNFVEKPYTKKYDNKAVNFMEYKDFLIES